MRSIIFIILIFAFSTTLVAESQERKTPEQEASSHAEKMQKELNLNSEQTEAVYRIQLKYAKQREESNSRSEALERVRHKENDLKSVLRSDQYERLKNKKFERAAPTPANAPQIRESQPQRNSEQPSRISPQRNSSSPGRVSPNRKSSLPERTVPQRSTEPSRRIQPSSNASQPGTLQPSRSTNQSTRVEPSRSTPQPTRVESSRPTVQDQGSSPSRRSTENQGSRSK